MADDDTRDERLARLLEVDALDELARRRLVTNAMRASAPPAQSRSSVQARSRSSVQARSRSSVQARSRLAAAAAVAAIVVVGGLSYLALRGDDTTAPSASSALTTTPSRADSAAKASPQPQAASGSSADRAENSAAVPRDVGDFGDLGVAANLDRLRASTGSSAFAANGEGQTNDGASLVTRLHALACATELPAGTIVAIGTGHFATRDAIVVETTLPDGTTSLDAVVADPCEVRPLD